MKEQPISISLFSGAFGLDLGFEQAGIQTVSVVENNPHAVKTIATNRPALSETAIPRDVCNVSGEQLLVEGSKVIGKKLYSGDIFSLCGGVPCQPFSYAGYREGFGDRRGNLFLEFIRIVSETLPRFCIFENVSGLLTAKAKKSDGQLQSIEEAPGSALRQIMIEFSNIGYSIANHFLLEAADYGVPQCRQRLFIIGSRDGETVSKPPCTHEQTGVYKAKWLNLRDAIADLNETEPEFTPYSQQRLKYLSLLQAGQNWRHLPPELQAEAMGGAYKSCGGKVGFYRRLAWDKPSPTITTSPSQKSTDMCHPEYLRPLSVAECAAIQTFPRDWVFCGSIASKYKQIGNAVPPKLGYAVAKMLPYN